MSLDFLDRVELELADREAERRRSDAEPDLDCPNVDVCDGAHGHDCVAAGYVPRQRWQADRRTLQLLETLDSAQCEIDELTAELAKREAESARYHALLNALAWLVCALPERWEHEFAPDSRRVLGALQHARAFLAEAGR
jgi:hypothetical protein